MGGSALTISLTVKEKRFFYVRPCRYIKLPYLHQVLSSWEIVVSFFLWIAPPVLHLRSSHCRLFYPLIPFCRLCCFALLAWVCTICKICSMRKEFLPPSYNIVHTGMLSFPLFISQHIVHWWSDSRGLAWFLLFHDIQCRYFESWLLFVLNVKWRRMCG